jgi:uncharacterized membrane protein YvbJ
MKCTNCGNEVDYDLYAACPHCKAPLPSQNQYAPQTGITMQDTFGNTMSAGGIGQDNDKPRRKLPKAVIILLAVAGAAIGIIIIVSIIIYTTKPRTLDEAIELARTDAKETVEENLFTYSFSVTWYENTYIENDGQDNFIIYCDAYGYRSGSYQRLQIYVGIKLSKTNDYRCWWSSDLDQLKTSMNYGNP